MAGVGRRGRAADGALAHDEPAQGRVADQEAGVDGDAAVEAAEPLAEGAPVPVQARPSAASGMPSTRAIIRER